MLTVFVKFLKILNSEQSPAQIAAAVALAAIIGLTPVMSLHNLIVLLCVLFFRVNLSIFLVAWPLFTLLGLLIEPYANSLGLYLLQLESMRPAWESFYNTLLGRWSNFYYTGVIGSLVIAIVMAALLYPITLLSVVSYRSRFLKYIEQWQILKMLKASKFWQMYEGLSS